MKQRLIVAAVGIPVLLLILLAAPVWATAAMCALLSAVGCYELMHEPGFPVLRIGNRMVVPKEQFIQ